MRELKATDKITQKMTRDGAVSENLATGEVEHISSREPEIRMGEQRIPLSAETADQAELCKGAAAGRENRKEHSGHGKKCGTESKGRLQGNFPLHQAP